jgi:hypothetical protein
MTLMKKISGICFGLLLFATNASALDFGVAAKVGINGVGVDLTVGLTKNINARITTAAIDIDDESETVDVGDDGGGEGEIDAELEFDYGANALLFDWHAFGGGFRFTAGMMKNNGSADLTGVLVGNIVVDGQPINQGDINNLSGSIELADSYQPYVGIGWGRGAGGKGGLSLSVDLGVAILDPEVDLDADLSGTTTLNQAELDTALRGLEADAEDDLDDLEFWPVFAIGVNYAF